MNRLTLSKIMLAFGKRGGILLLALVVLFGLRANNNQRVEAATEEPPVMLGIYPDGFVGDQSVIDEVHALDEWATSAGGKRTSLVGIYMPIEGSNPEYGIPTQLNAIWNNGYTPFIQLITSKSAQDVAQGNEDDLIHTWARIYASWSQNGSKMAFISPLPEMNTTWFSYAGDPNNFKQAYNRIRQIFSEEKVPLESVKWVFSPYAWSGSKYEIKDFYPGNDQVDILGIDAFNSGYCPGTAYDKWQSADEILSPYISTLRTLSPTKPIFISQIATTAQYPSHSTYDNSKKDQWLVDMYNSMANTLGVRAVLYFNKDRECDWPIYKSDGTKFDGYRQGVSNPAYGYVPPSSIAKTNLSLKLNYTYIPIATHDWQSFNPNGVMLGIYIDGYPGSQNDLDTELHSLDKWAGKKTSIVGLFIDFEDGNPGYNIPLQLETLRKNGFTGYINFQAKHTMKEIARGDIDAAIHKTAKAYASWVSQGDHRMAFIAPFSEMNGNWTTYGEDPANFKIGFQRVQNIFAQEGVPADSVQWVFAPNGYSDMPFEDFYPGDKLVDVLAFSSFNYGYCPAIAPWQRWVLPDEVYGPYIQRMQTMSPTKPIFIAQTATTARTSSGINTTAKNKWLRDSYNYLATKPSVKAIIYFNINLECDWPFYTPQGTRYDGYRDGVSNPTITYIPPFDMAQFDLTIHRP